MTSYYVGNGLDGALSVSTGTTTINSVASNINTLANSGQTQVVLASAASFAQNDWIFIHQTQGTGAGNYEFAKIGGIATNTLTLLSNLVNTYQATGAQVIKVPRYSSISVTGGTLTAPTWNGTIGGIMVALVSGTITQSAGSISMAAVGFEGGAGVAASTGYQGSSTLGVGIQSISANGQGGGGSDNTGNPHVGGGTAGAANLQSGNMIFGGGGGGHGNNTTGGGGGGHATSGSNGINSNTAGASIGGYGGGIIFFVAGGNITLTNVVATGGIGTNTPDGGSGAGGAIRLLTPGTLALGATVVTALGGIGGGNGGNGGNGRIATITSATVTGTSNPTIDTSSTDTTTNTNPYPFVFTILETVNQTENVSIIRQKVSNIFETLNLTETKTILKSSIVSILENFSLSETISNLLNGGWTRQSKNTSTMTNQMKH